MLKNFIEDSFSIKLTKKGEKYWRQVAFNRIFILASCLFLLKKIIPKIPDLQKETLSESSSIQVLDCTSKLTLLSIDKTFTNPR